MVLRFFFSSLLLILWWGAQSQDGTKFQEQFKLKIRKASSTVKIDGMLDEATWSDAETSSDFFMKWPNDEGRPKRQTYVKMSYDDQFIYVGVKAIDTNFHVVQTLKRDQQFFNSDAFAIAIDPVNQRTNGFLFAVTPYNVQSEDLVSAGMQADQMSFSWDNKWYSATSRHQDHWIAEIAIPLKTLRYKEGKTTWGINFLRADAKNNEFSCWTDMPINFMFYDFGFSGALEWDHTPPEPGTNISLIPYLSGNMSENVEEGIPVKSGVNSGFDAKVALSSSLNLDLTFNPDFSQVEVDKQVTNITRFNLFFPERRTFFLENDDLFSGYGIPPIRPFYTRTIGLDNNGNRIPILGGARITGNISKKTRIGLMDMQTKASGEVAAQNYMAMTLQQRVQKRSMIKFYFLNRQGMEDKNHKISDPLDKFGRNAGFQYDFVDGTGNWNAWTGYHRSFKEGITKPEYFTHGGGGYMGKHLNAIFDVGRLTDKYYTDMGFVIGSDNYDALLDTFIRKGFNYLFSSEGYTFYPTTGALTQIKISLENFSNFTLNNSLNESNHDLFTQLMFKNTASIKAGLNYNNNQLKYNTSFTDATPIPPGSYKNFQLKFSFNSDSRKRFSYQMEFAKGGFFNGDILQYMVMANYRVQPWGNFSVMVQKTNLVFPERYGNNKLLLVAPRIEVSFSNNLFWTTFLQYNNQRNNFNINSRLQWRYKPMSDLFLVYSDNYFTDPFMKNKNRALVFKLNYWLNL